MKRKVSLGLAISCIVLQVLSAVLTPLVAPVQAQGGSEPSFSYPGAGRFPVTSYFDHTNPTYAVSDNLTIFTTEQGLRSNGCPNCSQSGSITVCGYYTALSCSGRLIYYDGHPAFDYGFPKSPTSIPITPVAASASGTAFRRTLGTAPAVAIDHGNNYWSYYLHVDPDSRIPHNTPVYRGTQIALSSDTGTAGPHLHFEARFNGEDPNNVLDPYGWHGPWYTDPWNKPYQHTPDWWRGRAPLPMGYRNQSHTAIGPFFLSGEIGNRWDQLDGQPASPVNNAYGWGAGMRQDFEKGYILWNYSSGTNYYPSTNRFFLPDITDGPQSRSRVVARNTGPQGQVSILLYDQDGRLIDSRTHMTVPANGIWVLDVSTVFNMNQAWGVADTFQGSAVVYASSGIAVTVETLCTGSGCGDGTTGDAYTGFGAGSSVVYLPFAVYTPPPANQFSRFTVQNTGDEFNAPIQLVWINRDGHTDFTTYDSLDPNGSRTYDLRYPGGAVPNLTDTSYYSSHGAWTGAVKIISQSSQLIAAALTNSWASYSATYDGATAGATRVFAPAAERRCCDPSSPTGWSGFSVTSIQNLSSNNVSVRLRYINGSTGNLDLTIDNQTIGPNAAKGFNTRTGGDADPNLYANFLGNAWQGSIIVDATGGPVAVVQYTIRPTLVTSGAYTGVISQAAGRDTYLPAIYQQKSGSTWVQWSAIRLQNPNSVQANDVDIYFVDANGNTAVSLLNQIIPAERPLNLNTKNDEAQLPLGGNWTGSIYVHSDQPLVGVVETLRGDWMAIYNGVSR